MTWTAASFKRHYQEFERIPDDVVLSRLADAATQCDPRVFAARLDEAVGLLAAHKLALSPFGQQARLKSDAGDTVYRQEWLRITRQSAGGPWLVGQLP